MLFSFGFLANFHAVKLKKKKEKKKGCFQESKGGRERSSKRARVEGREAAREQGWKGEKQQESKGGRERSSKRARVEGREAAREQGWKGEKQHYLLSLSFLLLCNFLFIREFLLSHQLLTLSVHLPLVHFVHALQFLPYVSLRLISVRYCVIAVTELSTGIHVCILWTHTHTQTHAHTHMHACTHTHTHRHTHMHACTHTHTHTHICMHACMHPPPPPPHTHTHTCTGNLSCFSEAFCQILVLLRFSKMDWCSMHALDIYMLKPWQPHINLTPTYFYIRQTWDVIILF